MEAISIGELSLSRVVATEEVTDDTIATRHYKTDLGDLYEISST